MIDKLLKNTEVNSVISGCTSFDFRNHGDSSPLPLNDGKLENWDHFLEDMLDILDYEKENFETIYPKSCTIDLLGIGLSKGAGILTHAEATRPGSFHSLLLMEPIIYLTMTPRLENTPLSLLTLKRRSEFKSLEEAFQSYSTRSAMKNWFILIFSYDIQFKI